MLRKRSIGPSTNKQGLMSELSSIPSPTLNTDKLASSFFPSPRLFSGFSIKALSDPESIMSPTSILETKPFASIGNPFFHDRNARKPMVMNNPHSYVWEGGNSKPVGLGLVDALVEEDSVGDSMKKERRKVLFGSQLKIHIPPVVHRSVSPSGLLESPCSPVEFGIKTMNLHAGLFSPSCLAHEGSDDSLSASEMELSEGYTRVITHGPNPKTTHIFDNCVVESCGDSPACPSDVFRRFCHACGKNLGQSKDIFMYRGEKAFCSRECRCEMSGNEAFGKHQEDVVMPKLSD